jgi:hypothetical protein
LLFQQAPAHTVHGHAAGGLVEGGQQAGGFHALGAKNVQRPGAIFAGTPRQQGFHAWKLLRK